ncbi:hypothetical protein ACMHYB_45315 [Sorangium sp. So ce1128]
MQFAAKSEEEIIRDAGDDQLEFMANTLVAAYQLPASRAANMLHSLLCWGQVVRERRDWCEHIVHAEHGGHRESPITMFAERPLLKIVCQKLHKESLVRTPDAHRVSEDFRQRYCQSCAHRSRSKTSSAIGYDGGVMQERAQRNKAKAMRRKRRRSGGQ